jgi:small subunit ribosomal protein S6
MVLANKTAVYEGMFILDANRLARDREGLPRELTSAIEGAGGQMELSRLWEERRLAYPIKGQRKGAYWITYFHLPTTNLADLTRQLELKEGVLRHLFIRLPDSLVVPILEHAKGEPAQTDQPGKKDEKGKDDKASVAEAVEATAS